MKIHDTYSACASATVRYYYTVKLSQSEDVTCHAGLMVLWTVPEMASGIFAMCLPVLPKIFQHFKDSSLWSGPKSFIYSCLHLQSESKFFVATDENKASKIRRISGSFNIKVTKYNNLSDEPSYNVKRWQRAKYARQ